MHGSRLLWVVALGFGVLVCDVNGQTPSQKTEVFDRIELTDTYYSEGIAAGDVNGDGHVDVVYGPHWYSGPNWKDRYEIYPAKAQPRQRYADHFFAWLHDFNGDGLPDLLTGGFPGTPGYVYENPGKIGFGKAWRKHQVIDEVSHESPQLIDINGDGQRDLVFSQAGKYGFASYDSAKPFAKWKFTAISARKAPKPFGHGLGVGDINGDGRQDFLIKDGWFEHPNQKSSDWVFHPYQFAARGGAEMHVYDVDGDGDGDVISSLQAHDYGLAWFEQFKDQGKITFRRHLIMGTKPEENRYGVLFTELHSVQLADIDGDGLKDIVTGKTYWSHHTQSPMWDAGAVVYWFKLVRSKEGIDWVPFLADGDSGIGRQIVVADVDGNGLDDILTGGWPFPIANGQTWNSSIWSTSHQSSASNGGRGWNILSGCLPTKTTSRSCSNRRPTLAE